MAAPRILIFYNIIGFLSSSPILNYSHFLCCRWWCLIMYLFIYWVTSFLVSYKCLGAQLYKIREKFWWLFWFLDHFKYSYENYISIGFRFLKWIFGIGIPLKVDFWTKMWGFHSRKKPQKHAFSHYEFLFLYFLTILSNIYE